MNHRNALAYALFLVTLLVAGGFALFVSRSMTDSNSPTETPSSSKISPNESKTEEPVEIRDENKTETKSAEISVAASKSETNVDKSVATEPTPKTEEPPVTQEPPPSQSSPAPIVQAKPWFYSSIGRSNANAKDLDQQRVGQKFTLVLKESVKLPEIRKGIAELQKKNIHAFLGSYKLKNKSIYRVQYGVFISKRKAKEAQETLKADYDLASTISEMDEPQ